MKKEDYNSSDHNRSKKTILKKIESILKMFSESITSSTSCKTNKENPEEQICKTVTIRKFLDPKTNKMVF